MGVAVGGDEKDSWLCLTRVLFRDDAFFMATRMATLDVAMNNTDMNNTGYP